MRGRSSISYLRKTISEPKTEIEPTTFSDAETIELPTPWWRAEMKVRHKYYFSGSHAKHQTY